MADTTTLPSHEELMAKLQTVNDPEINLSIVDLGLVYGVEMDDEGVVNVTMTLTSPGCPLGPVIRGEAYAKLKELPGVKDVDVQIVWSPPWDPRTMASDDVASHLVVYVHCTPPVGARRSIAGRHRPDIRSTAQAQARRDRRCRALADMVIDVDELDAVAAADRIAVVDLTALSRRLP